MILIRKAVLDEKSNIELILEKVNLDKKIQSDYMQNTMVVDFDDRIVGCGGLDIHGDLAHIKFVAILPEYQNQRLGDGLVRALVNYADRRNIKKIYIADDKPLDYFKRFGFKEINQKSSQNGSDIKSNSLEYFMELDVDQFFNNHHCNCKTNSNNSNDS
ncbi:MAG: GNAT family N-acetyltransferase [Tepidanaerobacteraceae bacterium]|nr:GNAT family N-acetyltransferase [Thermoanaerobacterales bacterium]